MLEPRMVLHDHAWNIELLENTWDSNNFPLLTARTMPSAHGSKREHRWNVVIPYVLEPRDFKMLYFFRLWTRKMWNCCNSYDFGASRFRN